MITPTEFMQLPVGDRADTLDRFREHLAGLVLAEAALVIREKAPSAAWIRVRHPSDVVSQLGGAVEVVSIRDGGGYALGGIGKTSAGRVNALLGEVARVWPLLLGPAGEVRTDVDLPASPGGLS
jgi:hypothetical protein